MKASWTGPTPQAELGADATSTQRLQPRSPDLPLKKTTYVFRVSTKVLNKSNPIHGGGYHRYAQDKSRIRLRFICSKARFYPCRGLFLKRVFSKRFITNRVISGVYPTQRIQVLMLPDSSSAVAHDTTAGHFFQNNSHHENIPPKSLVV